LHKTPPDAGSGYPYIAIPQMKAGRLETAGARLITHEHFLEWTAKAKPKAHDVVLSRRCNPGETAVVPSGLECALGQNLVLLRANGEGVYPPFLRWLVKGPGWWEQVQRYLNVGAVFDSLRCRDVPKFQLPVPPIDEQRRIAAVLGALDDKIELNRQMNRTLEEMAQAIFKSWFVDFDGHDDLVDSELGPIPRGWRIVRLGELKWVSGGTPRKSRMEYWGGTIPWMSAKSLKGLFARDSEDRVTPLGARNGARLVPQDSVLFVVRGMSLASEFRCGIATREVTFNQDLKAIIPTGQVHPHLLLLFLRSLHEEMLRLADEASHGTKRLQTNVLQGLGLPLPSYAQQGELARPLSSLVERQQNNEEENNTLSQLRDTLLPKLISGEIRVPEAEKAVEAAT